MGQPPSGLISEITKNASDLLTPGSEAILVLGNFPNPFLEFHHTLIH